MSLDLRKNDNNPSILPLASLVRDVKLHHNTETQPLTNNYAFNSEDVVTLSASPSTYSL